VPTNQRHERRKRFEYSSPQSRKRSQLRKMKTFKGAFGNLLFGALGSRVLCPAPIAKDYPVKPVPFTAVHLNDIFWAPRIETNRLVTIPFAFEQCEKSGRMDNFERAAKALRGEELKNKRNPPYPFDDTDPYKVLEGASYALAVQPDPK